MDDATLNMLNEADWDDIAPRVLVYVRGQMAAKGLWALPGGHTAEDVVQEAIKRLYDSKRGWDPARYPNLCLHIQWIAKSLMSTKGLLGLKERDTLKFVAPEDAMDVVTAEDGDCALGDETAAILDELEKEVAKAGYSLVEYQEEIRRQVLEQKWLLLRTSGKVDRKLAADPATFASLMEKQHEQLIAELRANSFLEIR